MRLARFITENMEEIVVEWESFARSLDVPGADSTVELRDHAMGMLKQIALEIAAPQTARQKKDLSHDEVSVMAGADTAASAHGAQRQISGFTMPQLTAEFRAMRASVLRLWLPKFAAPTKAGSDDMIRFNEAIDQALQESAIRFADQAARTRDTFLAILGHDLRSPLATMSMAGLLLTRPQDGTEFTLKIGASVKRSAATMTTMVNDLLGYARTQLGGQMPIKRSLGDMRAICQAALDDAAAAHPGCAFKLTCRGDVIGDFDAERLQQVASNLLNNAAQYRGSKHPVTIEAVGQADSVLVKVHNFGPAIPDDCLTAIFDPMVQLSVSEHQQGPSSTSLGLGLFIARAITVAHGGSITAESSEKAGTVFTVTIPRNAFQ
jgi:signal transduction histidine kinase